LIRYHGLFAGNASERAEVVPKKPSAAPGGGVQLPLRLSLPIGAAPPPRKSPPRHPWAWLLMRVFASDVTTCARHGCGGRMRIVEIATERDDIARVLAELGLGARGPPPRPAHQVPGQLEFDFTG
jgi:hypothetical protein